MVILQTSSKKTENLSGPYRCTVDVEFVEMCFLINNRIVLFVVLWTHDQLSETGDSRELISISFVTISEV